MPALYVEWFASFPVSDTLLEQVRVALRCQGHYQSLLLLHGTTDLVVGVGDTSPSPPRDAVVDILCRSLYTITEIFRETLNATTSMWEMQLQEGR